MLFTLIGLPIILLIIIYWKIFTNFKVTLSPFKVILSICITIIIFLMFILANDVFSLIKLVVLFFFIVISQVILLSFTFKSFKNKQKIYFTLSCILSLISIYILMLANIEIVIILIFML